MTAKRSNREPGAYEQFAENFDEKRGHNYMRKTNLETRNFKDFSTEQQRADYMQSFFLYEHQKEMAQLQNYRT